MWFDYREQAIALLRRAGVAAWPRWLGVAATSFADLNAEIAEGASGLTTGRPHLDAFLSRLAEVLRDPALGAEFRRGAVGWFNPRFGLCDLAIAAGHEALEADDLAAASTLCAWLKPTQGPRAAAFKAMVHATNEDWGLAEKAYALSDTKMRAGAARQWEREERQFADVRRALRGMGVDWLDLRPCRPVQHRRATLDDFVQASLARPDINRDLLRAIVTARSPAGPMRADVAATVRTMSARGLRNFVDARTVCLVANSNTVARSGLGAVIDSYDVVMRFNSFSIDPENTGQKTNVHVCIHLYEFNLDVPVDVRIMISGKEELWLSSLVEKIRPGAQVWLGDASLRWPAPQAGLISKKDPFRTPTAGFSMLRLLMHFGVCAKLDLIGFDFYDSGSFRLPGAMSIAHSSSHNSSAERAWVMSRACRVDGPIISMRCGPEA